MITPRNVKHVTRSIGILLIITLGISVVFCILCLLDDFIFFIYLGIAYVPSVSQSITFLNSAFI